MIRGAGVALAIAGLALLVATAAACPKSGPGAAVPAEVELEWPDARAPVHDRPHTAGSVADAAPRDR